MAFKLASLSARDPAAISAGRGLPSVGGSGPQVSFPRPSRKLVCLDSLFAPIPSRPRGRDGSPLTTDAPPQSNDDANPWTVAQLEVQGPSRSPRLAPGLFVLVVFCTKSVPELFLPVIEPIWVAGMGEAPRLGDRLGLEMAEDDAAPSWALARRRFRGRMDAVSGSRAASRSVLEEEVREGFMASGILRTEPGASTRGNGSDNVGASDRGRCDHGKRRYMAASSSSRAADVCCFALVRITDYWSIVGVAGAAAAAGAGADALSECGRHLWATSDRATGTVTKSPVLDGNRQIRAVKQS